MLGVTGGGTRQGSRAIQLSQPLPGPSCPLHPQSGPARAWEDALWLRPGQLGSWVWAAEEGSSWGWGDRAVPPLLVLSLAAHALVGVSPQDQLPRTCPGICLEQSPWVSGPDY